MQVKLGTFFRDKESKIVCEANLQNQDKY